MPLLYLGEDGTRLSIFHLFPDPAAMELHFEGADARSSAAYEVIEPAGWEIYGEAPPSAVEMMRREAASAGVNLILEPEYMGGFLRTGAG